MGKKSTVEKSVEKIGISRPESYDINGGKILIFGDLHISSSFSGSHKHYQLDCYTVMDLILKKVAEEKASAVIFLGDLFGVSEKNIRDRQFLMRTQNFFSLLNQATKGQVFSVKGNHDMGDFTDFDFFIGVGLIKNPMYINYYGVNEKGVNEGLEVRFHLVNYGDEEKPLHKTGDSSGATDIVLGHSDYYIEGVTNWYSAGKGVDLSQLSNFEGVALVFSGHIHTPSDEMLFTTIKNGESIGLFYLGCPTRTVERYDDCWYAVFEYGVAEDGTKATAYDCKLMGLEPADEVFYPEEDYDYAEDDNGVAERKERSEKLTNIVKEIMDSRIMTGNINRQIEIFPGISDEVKQIAKSYLEKATV